MHSNLTEINTAIMNFPEPIKTYASAKFERILSKEQTIILKLVALLL